MACIQNGTSHVEHNQPEYDITIEMTAICLRNWLTFKTSVEIMEDTNMKDKDLIGI